MIRDVKSHFNPSSTFKPWIQAEQARKDAESHNQKRKRRSWKQRQPTQVKIGHGGTLDPLATGVLILGVGNGTKTLSRFLECTKSYEAVALFGAATDTYDTEGKIVARKGYEHLTREVVEEALDKFRGKIMQKPPIYSAIRVQGKKLYEYAREGKEVPIEIQERPMTVQSLKMVEWYGGGTHKWHWPTTEAEQVEKEVVEKVLHLGGETNDGKDGAQSTSAKRKREDDTLNGNAERVRSPESKRARSGSQVPNDAPSDSVSASEHQPQSSSERLPCPAPACRLRMTVTSGFYVRSLCHDLGAAVGSLGTMASLVRTRQADFELGTNVMWYEDLAQGEEVWGPKVKEMLEEWQAKEARRVRTEGKGVELDEDLVRELFGDDEGDTGESSKEQKVDEVVTKTKRRNTSSPEGD